MTLPNEQILKLAKNYGFIDMIGEKDDGTDGVYYECWKDQLLSLPLKYKKMGTMKNMIKV